MDFSPTWMLRRGGRAMMAIAVVLFLVASVSPVRERRRLARRLTEDAALSAALDGLPVAPSAKAPSAQSVNVYGLDPSLLAALQGSTGTGANMSNYGTSNSTGVAAASPPNGTLPPGLASAPAPWLSINGSVGQAGSAPDQAPSRIAPALPPRSTQYAPLDPYLAAALENQGRASPAPTAGAGVVGGAPGPAPAAGAGHAPIAPAPVIQSGGPPAAPGPAPVAAIAAGTPWASQQEQLADYCNQPMWQASTLKLLQERPFASLFTDLGNQTFFDPTGLEHVNNIYYVVFNRSQSIAYVPNRLAPLDSSNKLVALAGDANRTNYAGIAFCADTGTFMAVQEHRPRNTTRWGTGLHPEIFTLQLGGDLKSYTVQSKCWVAFNLSETITGFQDIQYHSDASGGKWLLGLCLGNHCATGDLGQDRGNGRIVVSHARQNGTRCAWVPDRVLSLPATAAFSAYTGLAIRGNQFLIASQTDSAVWLGGFNWDSWEFTTEGLVLNLPRNDACQPTYCNVGAVQWLDGRRISVASGVALPGDPWPCHSKSQALAQFQLPEIAWEASEASG